MALELIKKKRRANISGIDLQVEELANEVIKLDNEDIKLNDRGEEIKRTKKQMYREMAFHLKEKYILLDQREKIQDICSEIHNLPQFKHKPNIRIDVARSLDPEFIHKPRRSDEYDKNVTDATDLAEKSYDEHVIKLLKEIHDTTTPYQRSGKGNQRIAELAERILIKQEEWSDSTKIPLSLRKRYTPKLDDDKVTLEPAPPLETQDLEKLKEIFINQRMEIGRKFITIAKRTKTHNYVPRSKESLIRAINEGQAILYWIEPYYDTKWQNDYPQQINIYRTYWKYGGSKSYAASKSGMPVADVEVNPKTGKIQLRKLTKEEIEQKHDEILNKMAFMCAWLPINGPLHNPFEDVEQPYRKKRAHDLEGPLSEASL